MPEHRADSHDLHRAGSSALQSSGGDTPVERMRLSLLVDAGIYEFGGEEEDAREGTTRFTCTFVIPENT